MLWIHHIFLHHADYLSQRKKTISKEMPAFFWSFQKDQRNPDQLHALDSFSVRRCLENIPPCIIAFWTVLVHAGSLQTWSPAFSESDFHGLSAIAPGSTTSILTPTRTIQYLQSRATTILFQTSTPTQYHLLELS